MAVNWDDAEFFGRQSDTEGWDDAEFFAAAEKPDPWAPRRKEPDPEPPEGVGISDYGKALATGAIQGIGGLAEVSEQILGVGEDARDWATTKADAITSGMSPAAQESMHKELFSSEEGEILGEGAGDVHAWGLKLANTLGMQADIMLPGGAVTKLGRNVLGVGGKALAAKVHAQVASGMAEDKARKLVAKEAKLKLTAAAMVGYGTAESAVSAGATAVDVRQQVMGLSDDILNESPEYTAALDRTGDKDQAKVYVAEQAATAAAQGVALPTFLLGAVAGKFYDDIFRGVTKGGRLTSVGKGALTEAAQEAPQSAAEEYLAQSAVQHYADPSIDPAKGVRAAALEGAALGAGVGGMFGGAGHQGEPAAVQDGQPSVQAGPIPNFTPSHVSPDGEPLMQVSDNGAPTPGLYVDVFGNSVESGNATPLPPVSAPAPGPTPTPPAVAVEPGAAAAPPAPIPQPTTGELPFGPPLAQGAGIIRNAMPAADPMAAQPIAQPIPTVPVPQALQAGPAPAQGPYLDPQGPLPRPGIIINQMPETNAGLIRTSAQPPQPVAPAAKQEQPSYDFSSSQVALPEDVAKRFRAVAAETIDKNDIHPEEGLEDRPHITLKYGLHTENPGDVAKVLKGEGPITATAGDIEIFTPEGKDYDVVVQRVESDDLTRLNKKISNSLEVTDTFPGYKPHITIGYVKKGTGEKYKNMTTGLEGQSLSFDQAEFSGKGEGELTAIPLKQRKKSPFEKRNIDAHAGPPEVGVRPADAAAGPDQPAGPPVVGVRGQDAYAGPGESGIRRQDALAGPEQPAGPPETGVRPEDALAGPEQVTETEGPRVFKDEEIQPILAAIKANDTNQINALLPTNNDRYQFKNQTGAIVLSPGYVRNELQPIRGLSVTGENLLVSATPTEKKKPKKSPFKKRGEDTFAGPAQAEQQPTTATQEENKTFTEREIARVKRSLLDARRKPAFNDEAKAKKEAHLRRIENNLRQLRKAVFDDTTPITDDQYKAIRAQQKKPKAPTPATENAIGKNSDGETIYEDENGVRYVKSGNVRIQQKVEVRPTRAGYQSVPVQEERFEVAPAQPAASPEPAPPPQEAAPADKPKTEKTESAETKRARLDLDKALADLGDILLDQNTMKAVPQVDEAKLLPVLTRVLDAAFRLGYHKFKDSAKFTLDTIREKLGDDAADAITLDHLQGSYIGMAGKYENADSKKAVVSYDTLEEALGQQEAPDRAEEKPVEQPSNMPAEADEHTPEATTQNTLEGDTKLAEAIAESIARSQKLTWRDFMSMADVAYGGTQADGTYTIKQAYDAMEAGFNLYITRHEGAMDPTKNSQKLATEAVRYLEVLMDLLPTQTRRSEEQVAYQQFSSPPTHSFVVSWVANIGTNDVVLEPSAGTGSLLVHAKNARPKEVHANELADSRADLLSLFDLDSVSRENAGHLNAVLNQDIQPSVVVMNPPFSADTLTPGKKNTFVGANHVEQALKRLGPGGRLVAIVGRGMAADRKTFKPWWRKIGEQYAVRANIGISGKEYRKYGTSFDNQILVIDKVDPDQAPAVTGSVEKVADLVELLQEIRNGRIPATERTPAQPTVEEGAGSAETAPGPDTTVHPAADEVGGEAGAVSGPAGEPAGPGGNAGRPVNRPAGQGDELPSGGGEQGGRVPAAGTGDQPAAAGTNTTTAASQQDGGNIDDISGDSIAGDTAGTKVTRAKQEKAQELGTSAFEQYQAQIEISGAQTHPTALSESAAMSAINMPDIDYAPNLPKELIQSGNLSAVQLEAIAYAGAAHMQTLPDGSRRGFFIGDGTGVGKGAQAAGIILDNWRQGRKKAVWVSENVKLANDAARDLEWVGMDPKESLLKHPTIKGDADIKSKNGVLFTTYSTMASASKEKKDANGNIIKPAKPRIEQLVEWFGKDYDGVIVFDEAHNMANSIDQRGKRGIKRASRKALIGVELQQAIPNARVVYASATAATEVYHFAYAERLGLWGAGTPFPNKNSFISGIMAGGVAAMEVIAKDMKAMGMYMARSLSFSDVTYSTLEHQLTGPQVKIYDDLAGAWQLVLSNVEDALVVNNAHHNGQARMATYGAFWGSHQRFFNQVITAIQTPSIIKDVEKQLADGNSAVLQLVNTNFAIQERRMAQAADEDIALDDVDLTARDILIEYVARSFPTTLHETYTDDNGNEQTRPVVDSAGNAVQNPEAVEMRDALLERLGSIDVPEGVLEQIINHFGTDAVAEITGRSRRLVRKKNGTVAKEKLGAAKSNSDAKAFMDGKKRILIFSDAGGTGRSYHADLRAKNQQKRVHYLVQPGWRADKAVQGFGRTHRTNQKQAPHYTLVTTNLKAQRRFLSSIARRLDQLGALSKGQRDTTNQGLFDDSMNLENEYANMALETLIQDVFLNRVDNMDMQTLQDQMGIHVVDSQGNLNQDLNVNVQKFLNRLLSLDTKTMDVVFDEFNSRLQANMEYARQQGTLDVGMETITAQRVEKAEQTQVPGAEHQAGKTYYVKLALTDPVRFNQFDALDSTPGRRFGKNKKSGKLYAFYPAMAASDTTTGASIPRLHRIGTTGRDYIKQADFERLFDQVDDNIDSIRSDWEAEIDKSPKTHTRYRHMVTGALLPVWDRLPTGNVRIYRTLTEDGEKIVGRYIPHSIIKETLKRLGLTVGVPKKTPAQFTHGILADGDTIELSNGWKIKRSKVSSQYRLELTGAAYGDQSILKDKGAFTEMVAYRTRLFLPTDKAADILSWLIESKPIVQYDAGKEVDAGETGTPRFARAPFNKTKSPAKAGLSVSEVKKAILPRWKKMANRVPVRVVEGYEDLPPAVFAKIRKEGVDVEGVAYKGIIYLVAPQITSAERAQVVMFDHELRHVGLRAMLGRRLAPILNQAYMGKEGAKIRDFAKKAGIDTRTKKGRQEAAEEYIVNLAQTGQTNTLLQRLYALIRDIARGLGFRVQFSAVDLRQMVANAGTLMEKGRARKFGVSRDVPVFQRAYHGSGVSAIDNLSTDKIGTGEGNLAYGWGLYFSSRREVAEWYKEAISSHEPVRQTLNEFNEVVIETRASGAVYQVELAPAEDEYLLWDAPLSEQSDKVKVNINKIPDEAFEWISDQLESRGMNPIDRDDDAYTGRELYTALSRFVTEGELLPDATGDNPKKEASQYLHSIGIRGNKYLDGSSRHDDSPYHVQGGQQPRAFKNKRAALDHQKKYGGDFWESAINYNYVIFSDEDVSIEARFSRIPRTVSDSEQALNKIDKAARSGLTAKQFIASKIDDWRPTWLGALTRRHLADIGKDTLPHITAYTNTAQNMDSDRANLVHESAEVAKRWSNYHAKNKKQADVLASLMHKATIAGVDPSKKFTRIIETRDALDKMKVLHAKALGRSGEASIFVREIEDIKNKMAQDRNRLAKYPALVNEYSKLDPEAKAIYKDVRDFYTGRFEAMQNALLDRIRRAEVAEAEKRALMAKMRQLFESFNVQAPYFPLARFGDFWVSIKKMKNGNEVREFHMFENSRKQEQFAKLMRAGGWDITRGKNIENIKAISGASEGFVADVVSILDDVPGHESDRVKDAIYQLYLTTLPDLSARKHFIHRQKTEGYSNDALRAFAKTSFHGSYQLAKLRYSDILETQLMNMKESFPEAKDPNKASDLFQELQQRHEWAMNPTSGAAANTINQVGFAWYLGVTPSAAIVNITQTPMVAYPVMAAKYGWGKTGKALIAAMKDYMGGNFDIEKSAAVKKELNGDTLKAMQQLVVEGVIDKTLAHDLISQSETSSAIYNPTASKVLNGIAFLFHHAERFNREVTALATYRLAREAGKPHEQAIWTARDTVYEAHFDYSNANKARFMQSDTARVLLMFRQFSLNMTYLLARNLQQTFAGETPEVRRMAKNKLAGILGMQALAAGTMGLPLFWVVEGVLNAMFDDEDEPWEFNTEYRNFLTDYFGQELGNALAVGPIQEYTDVGIHNRVSINDLWFRSPDRDLEGKALIGYWLEQIAGPAAGIAVGVGRGYDMMREGKIQRGIEASVPKSIRDGMRMVRYSQEGVRSMKGDQIMDDVSGWQSFLQGIGFTPGELAKQYDANRALKNIEQRILHRRQNIMNRFALAYFAGDKGKLQDIKTDIGAFNKTNPTIKISGDSLRKSLLKRKQNRLQAQHGVLLNKRLRGLSERVRFAAENA